MGFTSMAARLQRLMDSIFGIKCLLISLAPKTLKLRREGCGEEFCKHQNFASQVVSMVLNNKLYIIICSTNCCIIIYDNTCDHIGACSHE